MIRQLKNLAARALKPDRTGPRLALLSDDERRLMKEIRARKLTYLSDKKLAALMLSCRSLEEKRIPGLFIEAGCALGGSTILLASLKAPERRLQAYDVFGMIPPPTQEDTQDIHDRYKDIVEGKSKGIGGDEYYGYQENLYEKVTANIESFGIDLAARHVVLIKGLVQDTLKIDEPVAFAHIDVDWYEPVMTCLQRIYPRLSVGGSIILDDYHDWGGCRKATDEYLRDRVGTFELDDSAGSMKITRTSGE